MKPGTSLTVNCPHCGIELHWDSNNFYRPFCSERCKMIDLGKWANADYRVEQPDSEADDFSPPAHQA